MEKTARDHYALHFRSSDPPPSGDGNMKSWLEFYKLNSGAGETYVPASGFYIIMREGDILWFILDKRIVAGVPILRVQEDFINKRLELWYDSGELRFYPFRLPMVLDTNLKPPTDVAERWLRYSIPRI